MKLFERVDLYQEWIDIKRANPKGSRFYSFEMHCQDYCRMVDQFPWWRRWFEQIKGTK